MTRCPQLCTRSYPGKLTPLVKTATLLKKPAMWGPASFLTLGGVALHKLAASGRVSVFVDVGDVCGLGTRVPRALHDTVDVMFANNVGDYVSPLMLLVGVAPLVRRGTGQIITQALMNTLMWQTLDQV